MTLPSRHRFSSSREAAEWSRRQWLQAGAFGLLAWPTPEWLARLNAAAAASPAARRAKKRVSNFGARGSVAYRHVGPEAGPDHGAPQSVSADRHQRAGMQFTELLPQTAKIADKLAVVRNFHHKKAGSRRSPQWHAYVLSGAHPGGPTEMPTSDPSFLKSSAPIAPLCRRTSWFPAKRASQRDADRLHAARIPRFQNRGRRCLRTPIGK